MYELTSEVWLPRPREDLFPFFADVHNLQEITPPWLHFQVLTTGPLSLGVGAKIDYRLRLRGIPIRWQSEITVWEPAVRFMDEQRRGPYRFWRHEHTFVERDAGTLMVDHVEYDTPGGSFVHRFLVRPDLEKIFAYRRQRFEQLLRTA